MSQYQRSSKTSPAAIRAAQIEAQALKLRLEGWNYDAIGDKLGVSRQLANRAVRRALARQKAEARENAKEILDIELCRLDDLFLKAMQFTSVGRIRGIEMALAVMDRRARYLGLNAPEKVVTASTEVAPLDLRNLPTEELDRLEAMLQKAIAAPTGPDAEQAEDLSEDVDYGQADPG